MNWASLEARAWEVLSQVPDPEVPALSLVDLGVVREVQVLAGDVAQDNGAASDASAPVWPGLTVTLTPTYSGCPATEVIAQSVHDALAEAGFRPVQVQHRLAPAWTTDWISETGLNKLRAYGIAPPQRLAEGVNSGPTSLVPVQPQEHVIRFRTRALACPRCGSTDTERLSAFGSTACKALHRCLSCREPFEHFKPI